MLPCVDSAALATARQRELDVPRFRARALGESAVACAEQGWYENARGERVAWGGLIAAARRAKVSIPPEARLPEPPPMSFAMTRVQVANETTLQGARQLIGEGTRPLALNFANGVQPGGGFLQGARAQEEVLCRSSALYQTLVGDPMYAAHGRRADKASTDWAILSPAVPVFRTDDGTPLDEPWLADFLTCAAPYAPAVGREQAAELLRQRIHRVLAIARAYGYTRLVLGAWGCGAFRNYPDRTARDFREALEGAFSGAFEEVRFSICDWSTNRMYLGPFAEVFSAG